MFKKILALLVITVSLIGISNLDSYSKNVECENYEELHFINNIWYVYVYTCDGTLVNIYEQPD